MIKKTLFQGIIIILSFLLFWLGFSQIDFLKSLKVKERTQTIENKLGDLIWTEISRSENVVTHDTLYQTLDKLISPICKANGIERDSIKIHIIKKDEINAFALPNNHLVVFTKLIENCKKQEALQGVLGHEIAHIKKNHVMKKISKEIGFSVLLTATSGDNSGQIVKGVLKMLSSSAYDRALEKEADITSVDYLIKAKIDPKPMVDFMYQMALDSKLEKNLYWIANHPESEERAKYILDYIRGKKLIFKESISEKDWRFFQEEIKK